MKQSTKHKLHKGANLIFYTVMGALSIEMGYTSLNMIKDIHNYNKEMRQYEEWRKTHDALRECRSKGLQIGNSSFLDDKDFNPICNYFNNVGLKPKDIAARDGIKIISDNNYKTR